MKFIGGVWTATISLFYQYTGLGRRPDGSPEAGDAIAAVFLPLTAMVYGFMAVAAAWIVMRFGYTLAAVVVGLAALAALGGVRQFRAAASLFSAEDRAAGTSVTATLIILFKSLTFYELFQYRGLSSLYVSLIYLPVAGAVAMLSAASVLKPEECPVSMFAAVKGGHMLLGCLLAFALMLPAFGLRSLAFVAASVLAGSVSAAALRRRGGGEAPYIAAIAGQVMYLMLLMLIQKPMIFY